MSEPKDTTSFFRKVVKFVANPTTEWAELGTPTDEARENEYAKSELKAMIERKRRNDFVRKREFDMLRKVRREGLTSEQLAALGGSSRLDDSEARIADSGAKQDIGVKAKIDEIEQQMVGDTYPGGLRRAPEFYNAPTQPAPLQSQEAARANALEPGRPAAQRLLQGDRHPAARNPLGPGARGHELRHVAALPAEPGRGGARLRPRLHRRSGRGRARPGTRRSGDRLRQCRL